MSVLNYRRAIEEATPAPPELEVVIEIPRGSFLKRGSTGAVDFTSPFPCPFNHGSIPALLGLEGDLLDAVMLGPRREAGTRIRVKAWGAVTLADRGMRHDKLICGDCAPSSAERQKVLRFFSFYAKCKGLLNIWRCRLGRSHFDGWCAATYALAGVRPWPAGWYSPPIDF